MKIVKTNDIYSFSFSPKIKEVKYCVEHLVENSEDLVVNELYFCKNDDFDDSEYKHNRKYRSMLWLEHDKTLYHPRDCLDHDGDEEGGDEEEGDEEEADEADEDDEAEDSEEEGDETDNIDDEYVDSICGRLNKLIKKTAKDVLKGKKHIYGLKKTKRYEIITNLLEKRSNVEKMKRSAILFKERLEIIGECDELIEKIDEKIQSFYAEFKCIEGLNILHNDEIYLDDNSSDDEEYDDYE